MDRMSPAAQEALARYRRARPGPGALERNLSGARQRIRNDGRRSSWRRQLGWGLASAAAAALVLVALDALLPDPSTSAPVEDAAPSEAVDGVHGRTDPMKVREPIRHGAAARVPAPAAVPEPAAPVAAGTHERAESSAGSRRSRVTPRPELDPPGAPANEARDALAEETKLLGRVRRALQQGKLDAAASGVAEHSRRFPRGALAEDRDAYAVIIACQQDRARARARQRKFAAAYPHSPHAPRIAEACESGSIP